MPDLREVRVPQHPQTGVLRGTQEIRHGQPRQEPPEEEIRCPCLLRGPRRRRKAVGAGDGIVGVGGACGGGGGGGGSSSGGGGAAANERPVFTSSAAATVAENSTAAFYTASANDPDSAANPTITLASSGDSSYFELNALTGTLSAKSGLDFELPADIGGNNIYNVQLTARDGDNGSTSQTVAITVTDVADAVNFGLNPLLSPSDNFDLSSWKVQMPYNDDGEFVTTSSNDTSDQIEDYDLDDNCSDANYSNGFQQLSDAANYTGCENRFFYTGADGGIVMRAPVQGARTSTGTSYTRTELREMLRAGDRSISTNGSGDRPNGNNWAFSSAPQTAKDDAGGVDGHLKVTLAVNEVTTTGNDNQIGRFVMGQIHADDDEPIRLYYRKLPGNTHGSIYLAHERSGKTDDVTGAFYASGTVTGDDVCGDGNTSTYDAGDDVYCIMLGSRDDNASNPGDGIQLGEVFSYEIDVVGNDMTVTIEKGGVVIATQEVDMSASGYDVDDDYMYFKAGVYQQNNSGGSDEFAQVTIYEIANSH